MLFARRVFFVAGIYGLAVLLPQYFMESRIGRDTPPAITHPEFFYGFVGVAVAWQVAFLVIARDPPRYRLMMLPAILEKATFGIAVLALYFNDRVAIATLSFAVIDLVWGGMFLIVFLQTPTFGAAK